MFIRSILIIFCLTGMSFAQNSQNDTEVNKARPNPDGRIEYKLLATKKTSTMQKDIKMSLSNASWSVFHMAPRIASSKVQYLATCFEEI